MIRPEDFGYNPETAKDNEFMSKLDNVRNDAIREFDNAVEILRKNNINIIVYDKSTSLDLKDDKVPDAVFSNNWISTDSNGSIYLYPMAVHSRNLEKNAFRYVA